MKLIIRADDLGFSEAVNHGIVKSVMDGLVTSVGMMPNMSAAVHGFELIKECDIALGQHTNICVGKPLCDPNLIPSLVDVNGYLCSSREIRSREKDTVIVAEAELEIEAQLEKFREITGRDPEYFEGHAVFSKNFFIALENVAKKNGLFFSNPLDSNWEKKTGIHGLPMMKLDEKNLYNPKAYFSGLVEEINQNECSIIIFHPGYLDQSILDNSSFTLIRPLECDFLCSKWLYDVLYENDISRVDFRNYKLT